MPAQPSWHARVPEILETLRAENTPPILDRAVIEHLFGLRRRQAIRLMGSCRGFQAGKTFLIDRDSLIDWLQRLESTGEVGKALQHKRRVLAAVNEASRRARAARIEIRADPAAAERLPTGLPPAIEITAPGRVQISYRGAEDLLAQIVELASAAANDFARFRQMFEGPRR